MIKMKYGKLAQLHRYNSGEVVNQNFSECPFSGKPVLALIVGSGSDLPLQLRAKIEFVDGLLLRIF